MKVLVVGLSRFFHWWLSELASCIPPRLRSACVRSNRALVVEFTDGQAVFYSTKGETQDNLGRLDLRADDTIDQRGAVHKIVKRVTRRTKDVVLHLPRNQTLQRVVDLPLAALENLREVLAFEMDRHTPFNAQEVYYDYRTLNIDRQSKWVKVELTVVARWSVDILVRMMEEWGLKPNRVAVAEDSSNKDARPELNLLPATSPADDAKYSRLVMGFGILVVSSLLVIAIYLPLKHQEAVLAMTEARLAKAQEDAMAADALQQQVATMTERSLFVAQERREIPTIMQLMKEASVLLPDHTWIFRFAWNGEHLTLSGYSADPFSLIRQLEESSMLSEVRFTSAVTPDPRIKQEQFQLSAFVARQGDD